MKAVLDVAAFHLACDVPIKDRPEWPGEDRVALRMELVAEEHGELAQAVAAKDMPATADGIADLIYVLIGMALEFGIPLETVWNEVQRANMAKVDPSTGKVRKRADGRILKPEGWTPPNIARALRRAQPEEEKS